MELVTLIDNKTKANHLKREHGLSFYLDFKGTKILFDLGQSDKLIKNAEHLGVNLQDIDYVVLSHGHYDHTGGLPALIELNKKAKVFLHKQALKERFSRSPRVIKPNHITWRNDYKLYKDRLIFVEDSFELIPGLWLLTNFSQHNQTCLNDERLVIKHGDYFSCDQFEDEIVIVAKDKGSPIALNGCAHHGIVNIMKTISKHLDFHHFQLIGGGLHLNGYDTEHIQNIINKLSSFKVDQWFLNHCTGDTALEAFANTFANQVQYALTGTKILLK